MGKVDIAGLKIDAITKDELLNQVLDRIQPNQKTFISTPYSEFLYQAFQDPTILEFLNKADFAVPDGIGIFWAKKYLEIPLTAKSYWGKIIQAAWQIKYSLAAILFCPKWIKSALPEKIVGADLVWDLAKLAAENNLSIYLLGGFGETPKLAAEKLQCNKTSGQKFYYTTKIAGYSNKNPNDLSIINDINNSGADVLLVAYGPIKQEKWIVENLSKLNIKLAVGVGGSFDYIAGIKTAPPKFIRYSGLEWLWRLFTQPQRVKRIFQATFGLISNLLLYKIFINLPYRKNAAVVILNKQNKILAVQRSPNNKKSYIGERDRKKFLNYWQFPQGGINKNENLLVGAQREALEETGLKDLSLIKISEKTNQYDFRQSWKRLWVKEYNYRGQIQNIVYFKTHANDSAIKLDFDELINYQWVIPCDLQTVVHPERVGLTNIVIEDLKEILKNVNI